MDDTISHEEELFYAARKLIDPQEVRAFLESACDGDPALRKRVEELLSGHSHAEEFFHECLTALRSPLDSGESLDPAPERASGLGEEEPGAQIGHYKILRKIGEGGCGAVYMGEQEKPIRRLVALKVIKLGMDTRTVIARFDAERQALAMMDHPNISKVLDAGATNTGRPYFVMELVRGVRITEYCDENGLDLRQRVKLFIQICHAIQHAHQKGIIHRDIKPSNILVTLHDGQPVPKVIDFGIAKATEARLTDRTLLTLQNQFIGTPAYMSPEQAEMTSVDIDTRSDIYSLGVLLYELLTGRTPFALKTLLESGVDEMRRTLREEEPRRPSVMLASLSTSDLAAAAVERGSERFKLIARTSGDLDWIVMKALEKDRARRYETADGLAMDLQRHLSNEPVVARPPSRVYRLQKLARRNRGVFIAAAAVTAALIAGLSTSTWLFLKEREAHRRAVAAERQQARLTDEAELARANEAKLRRKAEAREKFTRAEILVNDGMLDEADKMIEGTVSAEPSFEAATLLRSLGEWHALQGQWAAATNRLGLLVQADQLDGWDRVTLDALGYGVCLVENGDKKAYNPFRQALIARFAATTNAVVAERIVKISLLEPGVENGSQTLSSMARIAQNTFATPSTADSDAIFRAAWGSVSLALWEYRQGHYERTLEWAGRCLKCPELNAPRTAAAHVERAMAFYQTHHLDQSQKELSQGRQAIEDKLSAPLEVGTASQGFWFDWLFARILLQEATGLVDSFPSRPSPAISLH